MKSPVFLAIALLLLMLAAIGYQAVALNKVRVGKTAAANATPQVKQTRRHSEDSNMPTLAQLGKRNLMGDPNKAPKKVTTEVVPITALKLILMGTIIKTDGGISSALIQGTNRETKRYSLGEKVEGGFVLDSVGVDSVVLKRDEQKETLTYPANNAAAAPVAQPVPAVSATNPATRPQPNMPATAAQPNNGAAKAQSLRERMRNARANKNAQPTPAANP